jgi:hypothetical protein
MVYCQSIKYATKPSGSALMGDLIELSTLIMLIILLNVPSAVLARSVASAKARDSSCWAILGFVFGPLALIAIAGMPDQRVSRLLVLIAEKQGVQQEQVSGLGDPRKWHELERYQGFRPG